jgi:hypothetical protein
MIQLVKDAAIEPNNQQDYSISALWNKPYQRTETKKGDEGRLE